MEYSFVGITVVGLVNRKKPCLSYDPHILINNLIHPSQQMKLIASSVDDNEFEDDFDDNLDDFESDSD